MPSLFVRHQAARIDAAGPRGRGGFRTATTSCGAKTKKFTPALRLKVPRATAEPHPAGSVIIDEDIEMRSNPRHGGITLMTDLSARTWFGRERRTHFGVCSCLYWALMLVASYGMARADTPAKNDATIPALSSAIDLQPAPQTIVFGAGGAANTCTDGKQHLRKASVCTEPVSPADGCTNQCRSYIYDRVFCVVCCDCCTVATLPPSCSCSSDCITD